jgi:hypothetical protein
VAVEYEIINDGFEVLRDVYLELFVDGDVGPAGQPAINLDDGGYWADLDTVLVDPSLPEGTALHVRTALAYMYDIPDLYAPYPGGDIGGFFGVLLLNHTVDPFGETAPIQPQIHAIHFMRASLSYPSGDPANDAERYDALSYGTLPTRPTLGPDDYRYTFSVGPFTELQPGESLRPVVAFVSGEGYYDPAANRPDPPGGPEACRATAAGWPTPCGPGRPTNGAG